MQCYRSFKCKFRKIQICNVNTAIYYRCHINLTIQIYEKLHANGLEVMHSDIDILTTGHVRIKGHLSAQFV